MHSGGVTSIPTETRGVAPSPVELFVAQDVDGAGKRLRDDPEFRRIRPRVYARRTHFDALPPWDKYLARVHAAALVLDDPIFALESAAALLGLPIFGEPRDVHVYALEPRASSRFGDVVVHASAAPPKITRLDGIRIVEAADTTVDLARTLPPAFGLAVTDASLRTGVSLAALRAADQRRVTSRGRRRFAWVLDNADARSESAGESVFRAVVGWLGFAPPELQVECVTSGIRDRVDFAWPEYRVFAEFDGFGKYRMGSGDPMLELRREKDREARLRAHCRTIVRATWEDTFRVTPVERALVSAGIPRPNRRDNRMLATLR